MVKRRVSAFCTALFLAVSAVTVCADDVRNWITPSEILRDDVSIDDYTTTWYRSWLANYHFTEPISISHSKKGGENGQRCWSAAISPFHSEDMLIGGDTWGIYRSESGGNTWYDVSDSFEPTGVSGMIYHPDLEGVAFAMISNDRVAENSKAGIYKTTDGGDTWRMIQHMPLTLRQTFYNMTFSKKDEKGNRVMYAASEVDGGLWYSTDNGDSFQLIGLKDKQMRQLTTDSGGLAVAAMSDGIMYTADIGKSFEHRNNGLEERDGQFSVRSVAINPSDDTNWFCLNYSDMYESNDSGRSWKKIYTHEDWGMTEEQVFTLVFSAVNSENLATMYVVFGNNVTPYAYSKDYGKTWSEPFVDNELAMYSQGTAWPYHPLTPSPLEPDVMICSLDDEIYKSVDGGVSIQSSSSGLSGYRAIDWWFNPDDPYDWAVGCIDRGVLRSVDMGRHAEYPAMTNETSEDRNYLRDIGPSCHTLDRDPKDHNRWLGIVGDWSRGSIWQSTDGGCSFQSLGLEKMNMKNVNVRFNRQHPDVIYATYLVSYDNGETWETPAFSISAVYAPNNDIVYHASDSAGIWKSADCGRTWKQLAAAGGYSAYKVTSDYSKEDRLFLGAWSGGGIYIFDDGTVTKYDSKSGFKTNAYGHLGCLDIAQDPKDPNHLVTCANDSQNVAKSAGIFESYDMGKTWKSIEGMPSTGDAWTVKFHPTLPRVFIATSAGTFVYEYEKYRDLKDGVYTDIEDCYAKEQINGCYNLGLVSPYTDGKFNPDGGYRRCEFLYSIKHLADYTDARIRVSSITKRTFIDVTEYDNYYSYIQAAYDTGLIDMSEDYQFRPLDYITYQEAAVILSRLLVRCGIDRQFDDTVAENVLDGESGGEFKKDFYKLYYYNIIDSSMNIKASDRAKKADIAVMLYNAYKLITK